MFWCSACLIFAPRARRSALPGMQVEKGQWHRLESLESGTVILAMKDGAYEPIGEGDVLSM